MKKVLQYILLFSILSLTNAKSYGSSSGEPSATTLPWFTGPLLTPTAYVLEKGQSNIEPYLYWHNTNGHYNDNWSATSVKQFHQIVPQLTFRFGLGEKLDFSGSLQSYASWSQGATGKSFGDIPVGLEYQLYKSDEPDEPMLAKVVLQETFPTGRYQHLKPNGFGTDIGGQGTFATQIGFAFSKQIKLQDERYFRARWFISASIPTPVRVEGVNVYGGSTTTHGKVYPGIISTFYNSIEYTITNNWTFACDLKIRYAGRNHFKGYSDTAMTSPLSLQFSLAPAIEYNWNEVIGFIIGPWFSFAGKNSPRFITYVAALNYNF